MAIAFDAVTHSSGSGTSTTFSHTNNGNIVFFGMYHYLPGNTGDLVSGVTYGGQAMTRVNSTTEGTNANERTYLYVLANAPTGANNIVASYTTSLTALECAAASWSGAGTSGQPDNSSTGSTSASSTISATITSVADNCWMVAFCRSQNSFSSVGAGTTDRSLSGRNHGFCDSGGVITPAGSKTLTINWGGPPDSQGMCAATFSPPSDSLRLLASTGVGK